MGAPGKSRRPALGVPAGAAARRNGAQAGTGGGLVGPPSVWSVGWSVDSKHWLGSWWGRAAGRWSGGGRRAACRWGDSRLKVSALGLSGGSGCPARGVVAWSVRQLYGRRWYADAYSLMKFGDWPARCRGFNPDGCRGFGSDGRRVLIRRRPGVAAPTGGRTRPGFGGVPCGPSWTASLIQVNGSPVRAGCDLMLTSGRVAGRASASSGRDEWSSHLTSYKVA